MFAFLPPMFAMLFYAMRLSHDADATLRYTCAAFDADSRLR